MALPLSCCLGAEIQVQDFGWGDNSRSEPLYKVVFRPNGLQNSRIEHPGRPYPSLGDVPAKGEEF